MPTKVTVQNGSFQSPTGVANASGFLQLQLSAPAVVNGTGQVAPSLVTIALSTSGQAPATALWGNDNLTPAGTTYIASLLDSNRNQTANFGNWSFTGAGPIELNTMVSTNAATISYPAPVLQVPSGNQTISVGNLLPAASNTTQSLGSVAAPWLVNGLTITSSTATGNLVFATSPTLVTPNIGAATGTSLTIIGRITTSGDEFKSLNAGATVE